MALLAGYGVGCGNQGTEVAGNEHGHTHGAGTHSHGPDGDHVHEEIIPGPNNGRLITSVTPQVEFFVKEDRTVQLTFVNENNEAIPALDWDVSLSGGDREAPIELSFAKSGDVLVSDQALPAGDKILGILEIKTAESAEPVVERFTIDFSTCSSCQLVEYACICGH